MALSKEGLSGIPLNSSVFSVASVAGGAAGAGPAMVASSRLDRRVPSPVQIAPVASQARSAGSTTATSASESGTIRIPHRSLRRCTRHAAVTRPPVTFSVASRIVTQLTQIASLNAIRNSNGAEPSCAAGTASKRAVSRSVGASLAAMVTVCVSSCVPPWRAAIAIVSSGSSSASSAAATVVVTVLCPAPRVSVATASV